MSAKTHAFEADTGKILDIVIHSLYSNREIFLRELISNASDALDKRRYLAATDQSLQGEEAAEIRLSADAKARTLTISDSGIGMDEADMVAALGTIAKSGTASFLEQMAAADASKDETAQISLIGQFGVGFYAAFMVAEKVEVISLKAGSQTACRWESDGKTGFSTGPATRPASGTDIILHLKKDAREFADEQRISWLVSKYSDHIGYPVIWVGGEEGNRQLNSAAALWTRDKKDITDEQYQGFYNELGAGYDTPWMTLHNRSEGTVQFTSLLFVPGARPFDLFNPERKSRLQLYINRVFITDECEDLIPPWLRFVRGVVDTPDLDLNVSRELLQQNPAVLKIKKALIRRLLSELKKAAGKDAESFAKFWEDFGLVIKEGLYEDADWREQILGLCRFRSAASGALLSLPDYIEAMADKQEEIFYLSAESAAAAASSPHLEGFRKRGLDVLLMTDPVDQFWLPMIPEFEGKKFTSISAGAVSLDKFDENGPEDAAKEEKKTAKPGDYEKLLAAMKEALGDQVSQVRLSGTLTDSPACLVSEAGGMDIQMERLMRAQNSAFEGMPRILEINPDHPLIDGLRGKLEEGRHDLATEASELLFDQARILEGQPPRDLTGFARRLSRVMEAAVTASG